MKHVLFLAVALILVSTLTGCGGSVQKSGGASTGGGPTTGDTVIRTITVEETEFKLAPSIITLKKPGTYVFKAENVGSVGHALEIEGNGFQAETKVLDPGASGEIEVNLKPGTYQIYCPVDGHKAAGMSGKVVVKGNSGAGGSANPGQPGGVSY